MASGTTNRYKRRLLEWSLNGLTLPTNYYAHLVDDTTAPTADTATLSELTECSNYSPIALSPNTTDFPNIAQDNGADTGSVDVRSLEFTASGGSITNARYMVITDDNVTLGSREVFLYYDLVGNRTVSDGESITITGGDITASEV